MTQLTFRDLLDWAVAHESKRQQWMKKAMAPRAAPPPPRSSGNLYFRGARQLPQHQQYAHLRLRPERHLRVPPGVYG